LNEKWDPANPNCVFQHYFYNAVKPDEAPFYGPSTDEDPIKWDEALSNKPGPGVIPCLARGFDGVADRIHKQAAAVHALRVRIREINTSLELAKDNHELNVASRITEAKRKHIVFTQRTLALATKVQILRNRGYVMDQQEEELKKKLAELEKKTFDPVLGGRQEEIWARMSGVRERARILQEETEKVGKAIESQQNGELLTEDDQKALEKVYLTKLSHTCTVLIISYSSFKTTTDNSSTSRSGSSTQKKSMTHGRRRSSRAPQNDEVEEVLRIGVYDYRTSEAISQAKSLGIVGWIPTTSAQQAFAMQEWHFGSHHIIYIESVRTCSWSSRPVSALRARCLLLFPDFKAYS